MIITSVLISTVVDVSCSATLVCWGSEWYSVVDSLLSNSDEHGSKYTNKLLHKPNFHNWTVFGHRERTSACISPSIILSPFQLRSICSLICIVLTKPQIEEWFLLLLVRLFYMHVLRSRRLLSRGTSGFSPESVGRIQALASCTEKMKRKHILSWAEQNCI